MVKPIIIAIRLTQDQINQLDKQSRKNFMKRSAFIRLKLFKGLKNEK